MGIGRFIATFLNLYWWTIIAYVFLSWFAGGSPGVRRIYEALGVVCEPYLGLFRRFLPPVMLGAGGLDLSPFVGLIVLQIVTGLVARLS